MDKSRRRSAQYGYFMGENVSRAFTNSVKVTVNPYLSIPVTKLFFSNSSVYIDIDTCVETGKKVIFPNLNFFMLNSV